MRRQKVKEQEKYTEYPIEDMLEQLVKLTPLKWGGYAFYHEPLERKFSGEEKEAYTKKAEECGILEAKKLRTQFPEMEVRQIAEALGVKVETPDTPTGGGHVVFAQYVEPDEITIFKDCVVRAGTLIREKQLERYLPGLNVEEVLMAHELFHAVEFQKKKEIYTQVEKIELWHKPFSNKSRIVALSEIAAMAFAGEMTQLSFSPYVLDVLLMYGYNKEAACALYEEILEAAGIKEREEA